MSFAAPLYDEVFQARIAEISARFAQDSDSRDDLPRILEVLNADPPTLLSITDEVIARNTVT